MREKKQCILDRFKHKRKQIIIFLISGTCFEHWYKFIFNAVYENNNS